MKSLHPTVWRTCRVLANENRLKLLWRLFEYGEATMGQLANGTALSDPVASDYLRALNARGLIHSERRRNYVFYTPRSNPDVVHAASILDALKACYERVVPFDFVVYKATAFTHPRRIDIVRALQHGCVDESALSVRTQISPSALYRHVRKLVLREFLTKNGPVIELLDQKDRLSLALLSAALD